MKPIYFYSIIFWFALALVAVINGAIREKIYKPHVGDLLAHQISTVVFISAMWSLMYVFFRKLGFVYTNADLISIGVGLLIGTIVFEFIVGHYAFGNSWEKLFKDYNILKGRLWSIVLLATVLGPWIVGRK